MPFGTINIVVNIFFPLSFAIDIVAQIKKYIHTCECACQKNTTETNPKWTLNRKKNCANFFFSSFLNRNISLNWNQNWFKCHAFKSACCRTFLCNSATTRMQVMQWQPQKNKMNKKNERKKFAKKFGVCISICELIFVVVFACSLSFFRLILFWCLFLATLFYLFVCICV